MNNKTFLSLSFCLALIIGCSKDAPLSQDSTQNAQGSIQSEDESTLIMAAEGTQIAGNSWYSTTEECDYESQGATYGVKLTGDLKGCIYAFIDFSECKDGYYWEEGREHFVGTYKGQPGEFWTTYRFLGKFEGCTKGEVFSGAEIMGFCEHPLVKGSGTGIFEGVTGQYYMIDNVKKGKFPYRGNLKF